MAYAPVEPELKWLGSRFFWIALLALLSLVTAWGLVKARQYGKGDPGGLPTIGFEGPTEIAPGEKLSYRVHVHDQRTGVPLARERVRLTLAIDESEHQLVEGRTDANGQ